MAVMLNSIPEDDWVTAEKEVATATEVDVDAIHNTVTTFNYAVAAIRDFSSTT